MLYQGLCEVEQTFHKTPLKTWVTWDSAVEEWCLSRHYTAFRVQRIGNLMTKHGT